MLFIGGLGIIDLKTFNDALLAKWYWLWIKLDEKIWKSLFLSNLQFQRRSDIPQCSFFKENLSGIVVFCESVMKRETGIGDTIKFWKHNWGHRILKNELPILAIEAKDIDVSVQQVYQPRWITDLLHNIGDIQQSLQGSRQLSKLQNIMALPVPTGNSQDDASWTLMSSGCFSVKSAYQGMKDTPRIKEYIHSLENEDTT